MRVGVFGGTFDPVHLGHLLLAETCREEFVLDQVLFIPAANPPHKPDAVITDAKDRVNMLEFATAGIPEFKVDERELKREGPSYTVDTLQELHDEDDSRELFFLMGADSLNDLHTWKEPERISQLAMIVAVNRGGLDFIDRATLFDNLVDRVAAGIKFVEMPAVNISASNIRQRIGKSRSIRFLVPRAVEAYIAELELYKAEG